MAACDSLQRDFESTYCQLKSKHEDICHALSLCQALSKVYLDLESKIAPRKTLAIAIKRGICSINLAKKSIKEKLVQTDLDKCFSGDIDTHDLDIAFPADILQVTGNAICAGKDGFPHQPGDTEWADAEYAGVVRVKNAQACAGGHNRALRQTTTTTTTTPPAPTVVQVERRCKNAIRLDNQPATAATVSLKGSCGSSQWLDPSSGSCSFATPEICSLLVPHNSQCEGKYFNWASKTISMRGGYTGCYCARDTCDESQRTGSTYDCHGQCHWNIYSAR